MFKSASDQGSVQEHVEAVRKLVKSGALDDDGAGAARWIPGEGDATAKVSGVLPGPDAVEGSSGGEHRGVPRTCRAIPWSA